MRWLTHLGGARATIGISLLLVVAGEQLLGLAALFALTTSHLAVQVLKRAVARPRWAAPWRSRIPSSLQFFCRLSR